MNIGIGASIISQAPIRTGPRNSSTPAGAGVETEGEERRVERKSGQTRFERSMRRVRRLMSSGRSGFVRCTDSRWAKRRERAAKGGMGIVSAGLRGVVFPSYDQYTTRGSPENATSKP